MVSVAVPGVSTATSTSSLKRGASLEVASLAGSAFWSLAGALGSCARPSAAPREEDGQGKGDGARLTHVQAPFKRSIDEIRGPEARDLSLGRGSRSRWPRPGKPRAAAILGQTRLEHAHRSPQILLVEDVGDPHFVPSQARGCVETFGRRHHHRGSVPAGTRSAGSGRSPRRPPRAGGPRSRRRPRACAGTGRGSGRAPRTGGSRRPSYSWTMPSAYSGPSSCRPTAIIWARPGAERRPWAMRRQASWTSRFRVTRAPSRIPQAL